MISDIIFDGNGNIICNAQLHVFRKNTSERATTYNNKEKTIAHMNPVVGDCNGKMPVIFFKNGDYRYEIKDYSGRLIERASFIVDVE